MSFQKTLAYFENEVYYGSVVERNLNFRQSQ